MNYGLIGEKLGHSFSPILHYEFKNKEYELLEISWDDINDYLKKAPFKGLNVTIPYKVVAMEHCSPDKTAKDIGCVNTLVNKDGQIYGYNTDYLGFCYMVKDAGISFEGKKVVILGSGGTSKTACYSSHMMGASSIVVLSRDGKSYDVDPSYQVTFASYSDKEIYTDAQVIVNTTPVGMYPNNYASPIDLEIFTEAYAVVDVIYNPLTTKLVQDAREKGLKAVNGLMMLVAQAWYAEMLFFDKGVSYTEDGAATVLLTEEGKKEIRDTYNKALGLKQNIVLTGMAGCGKSTVGKALGGKIIDTDDMFREKFGMSAGDYIIAHGEPEFREKETEVVLEVAKSNGVIISTGGGVVLKDENIKALKQNGIIVYLSRDLKDLATKGRPLSQGDEKRKALFYKRLPIYMRTKDIVVENAQSVEKTAAKVMEEVKAFRNRKPGEKKMKMLIMNGPNINMLGIREPEIYGSNTYADLLSLCEEEAKKLGIEVSFYQSNHEGDLVDKIQSSYGKIDGIVFNPAAYTHTSVAILDAVKAVSIPVIEVHISKVDERDDFRQISYIRKAALKTISGYGFDGYLMAMRDLKEFIENK